MGQPLIPLLERGKIAVDFNPMEYKGFKGSLVYCPIEDMFFGRVLHIRDLVGFEGKTIFRLEDDFHTAVDEYIMLKEGCPNEGK